MFRLKIGAYILDCFYTAIQTSKSPFDIEKHRARVASIQKSPDGFAFSKRDMHIAGSSDSARQVRTLLFIYLYPIA